MRFAVTGSNGFIGSHLCEGLKKQGYETRSIQRRPKPQTVTVSNIDGTTNWQSILNGIDIVIHCASRVHVMNEESPKSLSEYRKVNVEGTRNLAIQAASLGVKRIVYISSIKVNGDCTEPETSFNSPSPTNPKDAYGISKLEAEKALQKVSSETGLEVVIVRPPLVYGPGVGGNFLHLLKLIDSNVPLPFGSVKNRRSLIYVGNLVNFLIKCSMSKQSTGHTFLVSDPDPLSTPELMKKIAETMQSTIRLFSVPLWVLFSLARVTGQQATFSKICNSLVVDPSYSCELLGWEAPFNTIQGLRNTAEWYLATKHNSICAEPFSKK
jgi:nucleoside-diphosphate-sugar epimerase